MMRLYIVRHGIADPRRFPEVKDEDRALTPEGIEKMTQIAKGLRVAGYIPQEILSSPLVRARQTADILLAAYGPGIRMKVIPDLAPGGVRSSLYLELRRYRKLTDGLMLVGHQPSLGEIAGEIAWGSPEHSIDLKKGGVCVIDMAGIQGTPQGRLVSLLTPSVLRRLL